jgi:hypothetical protein
MPKTRILFISKFICTITLLLFANLQTAYGDNYEDTLNSCDFDKITQLRNTLDEGKKLKEVERVLFYLRLADGHLKKAVEREEAGDKKNQRRFLQQAKNRLRSISAYTTCKTRLDNVIAILAETPKPQNGDDEFEKAARACDRKKIQQIFIASYEENSTKSQRAKQGTATLMQAFAFITSADDQMEKKFYGRARSQYKLAGDRFAAVEDRYCSTLRQQIALKVEVLATFIDLKNNPGDKNCQPGTISKLERELFAAELPITQKEIQQLKTAGCKSLPPAFEPLGSDDNETPPPSTPPVAEQPDNPELDRQAQKRRAEKRKAEQKRRAEHKRREAKKKADKKRRAKELAAKRKIIDKKRKKISRGGSASLAIRYCRRRYGDKYKGVSSTGGKNFYCIYGYGAPRRKKVSYNKARRKLGIR